MLQALLLTFYLFSFSFNGQIIDAQTEQPIIGAKIKIENTDRETISGMGGRFAFNNLPTGMYRIKVSYNGYQPIEMAVSEFTESPLIIKLEKSGEQTDPVEPVKKDSSKYKEPEPITHKIDSASKVEIFSSLDSSAMQIEEVLIYAIRAGDRTPITQKNIEKKELEAIYFGQDMPMLLKTSPAMTSYADGGNFTGYTYMRLRGIDQTRINMTLNGVPLNEPEDQGVYFSNFADFGNSIESIQIQRGVGTSTNGIASYGGSINFESINLVRNKGGEIQLGYGSFNSYRTSVEYASGLLPNRFAFYSRFSLTGTEGYRQHSGGRSYSFFMSGAYIGDKDIVKITAFSGRAKNDMAYLAANISDINLNPKTNYLSEDERDNFGQHFLQLQYSHAFNPSLDLSASSYYIGIDGNYDILAGDMLNFGLNSTFLGAMLNLNYRKKKLELSAGLHGNTFWREHNMVVKPQISTKIYSNLGRKHSASAFLKMRWDLGPFSILADLQGRYAYFGYRADTAYQLSIDPADWAFFNPKLGLQYRINQRTNLYLSAGMCSREPTRSDMLGGYDDIDLGNVGQVGNLTLVRPETVINVELGANLNYGFLQAQINGYFMQFRNEIAAIGQLSFFGLPLRKNVAESFRTGAELDFAWKIIPKLTFSGNFAYSYHRIKEYTTDYDSTTYSNVPYLLTPSVIMNASLEYRPFTWWSMALSTRYVSSSYLDNTQNDQFTLPAYASLDFRTRFSIKNHQLDFHLGNFTNARYFTGGYVGGSEPAYYIAAPINFFVTYRFKF